MEKKLKQINKDNKKVEYDVQTLSEEELNEVTGGKGRNGGTIVPGNGMNCCIIIE